MEDLTSLLEWTREYHKQHFNSSEHMRIQDLTRYK